MCQIRSDSITESQGVVRSSDPDEQPGEPMVKCVSSLAGLRTSQFMWGSDAGAETKKTSLELGGEGHLTWIMQRDLITARRR